MAQPENIATSRPTQRHLLRILLLLACIIFAPQYACSAGLGHDLVVTLHPDSGEMRVEDTVSTPTPQQYFDFTLNTGFRLDVLDGKIETLHRSRDGLLAHYRLTTDEAKKKFLLRYSGRPAFRDVRRMGAMPQGEISPRGVYLDGSSAWYPLTDDPVEGMEMRVEVPEGWHSLSIGRETRNSAGQQWHTQVPHDEIYLIAGPFHRHIQKHGDVQLSVWLRKDDPELAARYLGLMGDYIDHYSGLIGPYPFAKFAVVENRWQTGFGMPSFTLLGSRVMRLPFIPYTSLPHEILHNWLGNGIWIDYEEGNWSEGLTAYLADHWMKERRGAAAQYRLQALQRYSNFAAEGNDTPLVNFVSRHDDASQSIGYSKSLMLFHMLRTALGDEAFVQGLQRLWQLHRYRRIGFADALQTLLGEREDLFELASQWLHRTGAPRLQLDEVEVTRSAEGYRLAFEIRQKQTENFAFELPIAVMLEGREKAQLLRARIDQQQTRLSFDLDARPLRLDIDPGYDLLRQLDASEQPPALNRLLGRPAWLVLPTRAEALQRKAWEALAEQWRKRYPRLRLVGDDEAATIPEGDDRLILGWQNRLLDSYAGHLARDDQALHHNQILVEGETYGRDDRAVVLTNNNAAGMTIGFIGAPGREAITQLARKLPHYGSYGRLLFSASGDRNLHKARLRSEHSTLTRQLTPAPSSLHLEAAAPLSPPTAR